MKMYAVIDTDVFVSALLSRNADAATSKILFAVLNQKLLPLYNEAIMNEYTEVLRRSKFTFPKEDVDRIVNAVLKNGILKHFPRKPIVVTSAEMVEILGI